MTNQNQQIAMWRAEAEALIKWGCDLVGMSDVADNIMIHYSETMRTTRGRAFTHYGPHDKHIINPAHKRSALVQEQMLTFNGNPRGGLLHFCITLYLLTTAEQRRENVLHELAHILANLKANESAKPGKEKNTGHKHPWKTMMRRLGLDPKRCHDMDTTGIKRRQARYRMYCPDRCGWGFTFAKARRTRRINEARRGTSRRWCPKCKATITLQHWLDTKEV